jgi:hypothetical protein
MATTNEKVLVGALIATIIIAGIIVALVVQRTIFNTGTIEAIGFNIYSDINITTPLTQINWGQLKQGELIQITAFAFNSGNVNITLSFITTSWNPTYANNSLTFGWNYTGQIIQPLTALPLQLWLQVSPTVTNITSFSFNVVMNATQV